MVVDGRLLMTVDGTSVKPVSIEERSGGAELISAVTGYPFVELGKPFVELGNCVVELVIPKGCVLVVCVPVSSSEFESM